MKQHLTKMVVAWAAGCTLWSGCAAGTLHPEIASSEKSPEYAVDHPAMLNTELTRYTEATAQAKENIAAFPGYAQAVSAVDPAVLQEVYEEADRTGRGRAFAERMNEQEAVRTFFDREKEDLARRINAGVNSAKEKAECSCELDTYGPVSYGLKEGVSKRLEKSLAETGERDTLFEKNEKAIGKKHLKTLSEQADTVAWTAHTVYVALPTLYNEMNRLLSEAKAVRKTLDKELAAAKTDLAEASSRGEKKAAEKRIQTLEDARNAVDIFEGEADRLVSTAETDIPELRSAYDKAVKDLLTETRNLAR